jgi:hypothetical protein
VVFQGMQGAELLYAVDCCNNRIDGKVKIGEKLFRVPGVSGTKMVESAYPTAMCR